MKIKIVYYSQTNFTESVALRLEEALKEKGHEVVVEAITTESEKPQNESPPRLKHTPTLDDCDVAILGSPVWAFSLSGVMKAYLDSIDKAPHGTLLFATQFFPFPCLGGNRALRVMEKKLRAKGAHPKKLGVWSRSRKKRGPKQIEAIVHRALANLDHEA